MVLCAFAVGAGVECFDAGVGAADDAGVGAADTVAAGADAVDDADSDDAAADVVAAADDDAAVDAAAVDAESDSALRRLATEEFSIDQSLPAAWHCRCCLGPPSCNGRGN